MRRIGFDKDNCMIHVVSLQGVYFQHVHVFIGEHATEKESSMGNAVMKGRHVKGSAALFFMFGIDGLVLLCKEGIDMEWNGFWQPW